MRRILSLCAVALLLAAGVGCNTTRQVAIPVYQDGTIEGLVRSTKVGGEVVERGYSHPAVIAAVRLAHALSFVDVEVGEGKKRKRIAAVHPEIIYEVADALEAALAEAGPDQEAVVMATRRERRMGLFHADFLTSLSAHVRGDLLAVHFGHVDWEVPKIEEGRRRGEMPLPREGVTQMKFRIVPGTAVTLLGPQSVALDWRSERFAEPSRIELTPEGQVRRRTILLEDTDPEPVPDSREVVVPITQLAPATLRALADLEEARQRGEITEGQYQERRRELLQSDPAAR